VTRTPLLPPDAQPKVAVGDTVFATETVLAAFPPG